MKKQSGRPMFYKHKSHNMNLEIKLTERYCKFQRKQKISNNFIDINSYRFCTSSKTKYY